MQPKAIIKRLDLFFKKSVKVQNITTKNIGDAAEQAALEYLIEQGLNRLDTNYHSPYGEIDIVMGEGHVIVFIEVRYRKNNSYGGGATSITASKQKKLIKTASHYLKHHQANVECRFDVMAMGPAESASADTKQPFTFNWIKNAFISS
jgi:putative endonuclease|tara:strand:+ start:108 stop:551 length:444 start_codon:yes stop_codon:yes gene_type:complete